MGVAINNAVLRAALAKNGYQPAPGGIYLAGIRGAKQIGPQVITATANEIDRYNDLIVAFGREFRIWKASVDPGLYYTKAPMNPDGCAHLMNGHHRFKPGYHLRSKYGRTKPCLVQAEKFQIWRDADRDNNRDAQDPVRFGDFGIHVHAAGQTALVGKNSAGCQVLWGGWQGQPYQEFLNLFWEPTLTRVTDYFLFDFSLLTQ